jgi:2-polyprenyl-3-methyl-5-hydroxy-6-metoxy-1,4-benzoquinol methylase
MSVGPWVRKRLGPYEFAAAEAYRGLFIDLDALVSTLARLPGVSRILEVGAGEGALATRLCIAFPQATYLGIDVVDAPGRLFRGDDTRAEFRRIRVEELPPDDTFDLVVITDVLHHVPPPERRSLLRASHSLLRMGGHLVVKEWERGRNPWHFLTAGSDRYLSGDKGVEFFSPGELPDLLGELFPKDPIAIEARVPPRKNNILLVLQRL